MVDQHATGQQQELEELRNTMRALDRSQGRIEFTLDGKIITANDNFLKAIGYTLEEAVGMQHSKLCSPDYAASEEYREFWRILNAGQYHEGLFPRINKRGEQFWIRATYNPVKDAEGKVYKVVKFATDATEEAKEIATAKNLSGMMEALGRVQGILEFDMEGHILQANERYLKRSGYSLEEIRKITLDDMVPPAYVRGPQHRELWEKLRAGQFFSGLVPRVYKGNEQSWVVANYSPVLDEQGRPVKVVGLSVDGSKERNQQVEVDRLMSAVDGSGSCIMLADAERKVVYANPALKRMLQRRGKELRQRFSGFDPEQVEGQSIECFFDDATHNAAMLADEGRMPTLVELEASGAEFRINATLIKNTDGEYMGNMVEWQDVTQAKAAEREIRAIIHGAARGQFDERLDAGQYDGFFRVVSDLLNDLMEVTGSGLNDIAKVMNQLSAGDLSGHIEGDYQGLFGQLQSDVNTTVKSLGAGFTDVARVLSGLAEGDLTGYIHADHPGLFAKLKADMNSTMDRLNDIVGSIRESTSAINTSAGEISKGNLDLSQRTEEQASSLEETASSMEQMTSAVKSSADNAREANALAEGAQQQAEKGGEVVGQAISAMQAISDSSNQISDIISVIDEIAFQTNLLALNAAVEAARAGEQGRGFAVVAAEVRNLAQRSAEAAKEIKTLIKTSVAKVEDGSRLVDSSGETLTEIVSSVKKVTGIIAEIASAAQEQSSGIEQVNNAVTQLDEVTQQNAALVEEAAAASKSMDEQTKVLEELVSQFKLASDAGPGAGVRAAAPPPRPAATAAPRPAATAPQHVQPVRPAQQPQPTKPARSAPQSQPAKPVQSAAQSQPPKPVQSGAQSQPAKPAQSTPRSQPTKPVQPAAQAQRTPAPRGEATRNPPPRAQPAAASAAQALDTDDDWEEF
jgi:methyl-accepting chemotaxis protein